MATVRSRLYTPVDHRAHEAIFSNGIYVNITLGGRDPIYQLINEGRKTRFLKRPIVKLIHVDTHFQKKMECELVLKENTTERAVYEGSGIEPLDGKKYHYTIIIRVDLNDNLKQEGVIGSGVMKIHQGLWGFLGKDDIDVYKE